MLHISTHIYSYIYICIWTKFFLDIFREYIAPARDVSCYKNVSIIFSVKKIFPVQTQKFAPLPRPSPPTLFIDDRVTASRSRRLRVLLTGRHGNLATSLQWPKVDGLRAGAPEQTEEKSVHARTRNRTCTFVRLTHARFYRSLFLLFSFFLPFSLTRSSPPLLLFSRSRRDSTPRTCSWCLWSCIQLVSRLPEGRP